MSEQSENIPPKTYEESLLAWQVRAMLELVHELAKEPNVTCIEIGAAIKIYLRNSENVPAGFQLSAVRR